jgi:protein TonB
MFKVLNARKRRVISPTTVAASIAAHLLLLGGAVYAAANDTGPREEVDGVIVIEWEPTEPAPKVEEPAPPPPPAPQAVEPDAPAPVPGQTLQLESLTEVPETIAPEPPGVVPVDDRHFTGKGPVGNVIGTPPATPTPPAVPTNPAPPAPYVPNARDVEEQPELNRDGLSRTMERFYPSILRDSRTTGRVLVELIVDVDGRVRPGSAEIVEATHPAFGEATLRAVERFRFNPARMGGVPVPVRVTIPINWTVPD